MDGPYRGFVEPANRIVRVTRNGEPIATVELTREIALSYMPDEARRMSHYFDGWIPDSNRLTVAHLIAAQARARTIGITSDVAQCCYRMTPEAMMDIEAALVGRIEDAFPPRVICTFRGFRVEVVRDVPWCDFDVTVPA